MNGKYGSWRIDNGMASRMIDGEFIELPLEIAGDGTAVATYGRLPEKVEVVLMGMCLFDARWQVQFKSDSGKGNRGNPPARRSLALPHHRDQAYERIASGKKVDMIHVPNVLSIYHRKLLAYQAKSLRSLNPKRVLYHLPVAEYMAYIYSLEQQVGSPVPKLHEALARFVKQIEQEIGHELGFAIDRIEFISPMNHFGVTDTVESYLHPYVHFAQYDIDPDMVIGVEDLVELRLSRTACERTGVSIPVQCLIMDASNPYTDKTLREGEFESIKL